MLRYLEPLGLRETQQSIATDILSWLDSLVSKTGFANLHNKPYPPYGLISPPPQLHEARPYDPDTKPMTFEEKAMLLHGLTDWLVTYNGGKYTSEQYQIDPDMLPFVMNLIQTLTQSIHEDMQAMKRDNNPDTT